MPVDVSVIVPTRNRAASLRRTLDALATQTYPPDRYELIVVANDCSDGTVGLVRAMRLPCALRVIDSPEPGIAGARNTGAAAAAAAAGVLVFLDDDVEASPGLVAAHTAAHREAADADLVAVGALPVPPASGHASLLVERLRRLAAAHQAACAAGFDWWLVTGGNLSIAAAFFHRLGGFDATPTQYGGEDYEFACRAHQAGGRFAWIAGASGVHHHASDMSAAEYLARAKHAGRHDVLIARQRPAVAPYVPLIRGDRPHTVAGRLARALAFDRPAAGDRLAVALGRLGRLLAAVRWERPWNRLVDGLYDYWYFRGVGLALGGSADVREFLHALRQRLPRGD